MLVGNNMVVSISYTLTNNEGEVLDQSPDGQPLKYLHGADGIIPGLEKELNGKAVGSDFDVTIAPDEGYGQRNDALIQQMPKSAFPTDVEVQAGMQFNAQSTDGQAIMVTVAEVDEDTVTVDGNHPLAGITLHFKGKVEDSREATAEELDHGHVH